MAKLSFSSGCSISAAVGTELLQIFRTHPSLPLRFGCCQGQCGTCLIHIEQGEQHLSKRTKQEERTLKRLKKDDSQFRLACQCALLGDVTIH